MNRASKLMVELKHFFSVSDFRNRIKVSYLHVLFLPIRNDTCLHGLGAPVMTSPKQGMERHLLNWTFETVHLLPDITRACGPWALSRCMVVLAARGPCPERTPGLTPQTVPSTSCHWNDCLHPPRCPPRSTEDHTASHGSFLSVWQICLCNRACRMC